MRTHMSSSGLSGALHTEQKKEQAHTLTLSKILSLELNLSKYDLKYILTYSFILCHALYINFSSLTVRERSLILDSRKN
jgi:hypothetical protein